MTLEVQDTYGADVAAGRKTGVGVVHKFGRNAAVGTSFVPICFGGVYQTPTTATALEAVSDNVNDTAAGSGAQELTIIGLDANWAEVSQTVEMNGTTAVALTTPLTRLYRYWVSRSGTYATTGAASHAGDLIIRVASAGATWATIDSTDYPKSQSEIGCYSIPANKRGFISRGQVISESSKAADVLVFRRLNADDVTTPYTGAMRLIFTNTGFTGRIPVEPTMPSSPILGPADVILMGKLATGSGAMEADIELYLEDL